MREDTINRIRRFTEDRDWDQFHSPANLAKSLVIEAAELLECFQWSDTDYDIQHVKEELADVIVYSQNMLDKLGLDADEIVNAKMSQNEAKYPVDKAKGNAAKYTDLFTRHHGTGLGGYLLQEGISQILTKMNSAKIYIEAQCYAVGFYEREGFRICSEEFLEDGIPHVQMVLQLNGN